MTSDIAVPTKAGPREWAALVILALTVTMLAVDGTVLSLAVPALSAELAPTNTQILWIGDIYSLALAGLLVTMGNLADRVGRKKLLLIGSTAFGIASVIAAYAPTPELLIAARALLGVAGATIMPSTLSLVRNIFLDPAQRRRAIAVWSAGATGGAALGPLVGGLLLENFWWGSVFLVNVPIILIVLIGGFFLIPESRSPDKVPIDLLSALLATATLVPLVYAAKHTAGYGIDLSGIVTAVVGLIAGYLFIRRQRTLEVPLIDVRLFKIPAFSGAVGANTISIFAFVGLLFFFSQYLQLVLGFTPLQAGLLELPSAIASFAVIAVISKIARIGVGRAVGIGLGLGALGLIGLAISRDMDGLAILVIALAITGLGTGIAQTLSTDAVIGAVPKERAGAAASISETAYEIGVALGIAILGSMQTAFYRNSLVVPDGATAEQSAAAGESLAGVTRVAEEGSQVLLAAQSAFADGMQITSYIAAALLIVAAFIAWRTIPSNGAPEKVDH